AASALPGGAPTRAPPRAPTADRHAEQEERPQPPHRPIVGEGRARVDQRAPELVGHFLLLLRGRAVARKSEGDRAAGFTRGPARRHGRVMVCLVVGPSSSACVKGSEWYWNDSSSATWPRRRGGAGESQGPVDP